MSEIRVTDWNELNEQLYESSWQDTIGRYRSNFAFRGLSNARHRLQTTLSRMAGTSAASLEDHMMRTFKKYAHHDLRQYESLWYWWSLAQHHGLPTRLMDWTYSPYVAMHFATADIDQFDIDGVIWCVDFVKASTMLPDDFRKMQEQQGTLLFSVDMLDKIMEMHRMTSLKDLETLSPSEFVVFFEPPSLDERIVNQFALFSVFSKPNIVFDDWLQSRPEMYRKIIIPAGLKWEVRDKLDQANITERVLFPGLDGLSQWLKRYYSPMKKLEAKPKAT
jgi:hypothetical protein